MEKSDLGTSVDGTVLNLIFKPPILKKSLYYLYVNVLLEKVWKMIKSYIKWIDDGDIILHILMSAHKRSVFVILSIKLDNSIQRVKFTCEWNDIIQRLLTRLSSIQIWFFFEIEFNCDSLTIVNRWFFKTAWDTYTDIHHSTRNCMLISNLKSKLYFCLRI